MKPFLTPIAKCFVLSILLVSCAKDRLERGTNSSPSLVASMSELEAPAHFDWRTTEERTFILSLGNHTPSSAKYRLEWYTEHPSTGADMRHVALIDKSNPFVGKVTLPKYAEKVFIKLITPNAQSSIQEFDAGPTTSHTFFTGKRSMKMSTISSNNQIGADLAGLGGSHFGTSVSMSSDGMRIAVGAIHADEGYGRSAGKAQVFEWNGTAWDQIGQSLFGTGQFGFSISLSADGNRLAVTDRAYSGQRGRVKIYNWNGSSWSGIGQVVGESSMDWSGWNISLSDNGNRLAVGAPENDGVGNASGHTRVYNYNGGSSWSKMGADIDAEAGGDKAGTSVSLSSDGSIVAIGAPENDGNGDRAGNTRIYEWDGSSWNQMGTDLDGAGNHAYFGSGVSLSDDGHRVAIGARGQKSISVFDWNGTDWTQVGATYFGTSDHHYGGWSVSLSADGERLVFGAPGNIGWRAGTNGRAAVLEWDGSSWSQLGSDVVGNGGAHLGADVCMSGNGHFFVAGAPYTDTPHSNGGGQNAGKVEAWGVNGMTLGDSDNDGVDDINDDYPNDITRAYDSFNPSENSFGTAMFEDLWPHEGDYDFNDVVVSWRQQLVSNADNKIVEAKIKVVKVARGGSLESGFGLKLGTVPSNKVASVTGCQLSGFATIGANGVEDGQTYANIIFWDKISQAWPNTTGASMQNTISANPHSTEDTTDIVVTFTEPIEGTLLNNGGPYIWVNNERGREIHPAGSAPTNLVDPSYFGTGSDNSDPNDVTTMYKGNGNRPWALVIFEETAQTEEKVDFTEAYLKFSDWALSSGGSYNDWYQDKSDYRGSSSKFYTK